MKFSVAENAESFTIANLQGSLDVGGSREIENDVLAWAAEGKSLILDISGVDFIGSMGMRLLIGASKSLNLAGKKLVLFHPQAQVAKVLEAAGMTNVLTLAAEEAEARAAVS